MEPEVCQCKYQGVFRYETSFVNIRIIQIFTQRFKLQQRFMQFHMKYVPSERFQYRKISETFEIDFSLIGSIQFHSGTQFAQNVSHPTLIAMMLSL